MPVRSGFAAADDGVQLYWRSVGQGGPPLICCNGVGVSTYFFKYIVEHFRTRHQVVVWDYRGHGRSGMPPEPIEQADLSIESSVRDLAAVWRAADLQGPAILLGHSMGCQVIYEFAHQFPDEVAGLVGLFGTAGRPMDTFFDSPHARGLFDVVHRLVLKGGRGGARLMRPLYASPLAFGVGSAIGMIDRHYAGRLDIHRYLEHLGDMDPRVFFGMVAQICDHDAGPYLPELTAPLLVIAGEKDRFTPLYLSRRIVAAVPGAELMVLADASHAAIVEHPASINRRIERFIAERITGATTSPATGSPAAPEPGLGHR